MQENWSQQFVSRLLDRISADKGVAAALRRADNPNLEYRSWEILADLGVDLSSDRRIVYTTVAAAVAKAKIDKDGTAPFMTALAHCYEDRSNSEQARRKLRRLLACDSSAECCTVLRGLLRFIQSRVNMQVCYADLLRDLLTFDSNPDQVKVWWTKRFFEQNKGEKKE